MIDSGSCCSPRRNLSSGGAKNQSRSPRLGGIEPPYGWALIPDGEFWMGNDRSPYPGDGEGPRRRVWLDSYQLSVTTVTNSEFQRFVNATGYVTDAEKYGWSFVFEGLLLPGEKPELLDSEVSGAPWWKAIKGACWQKPFGDSRDQTSLADHPVVHISHNDAQAFCDWAQVRLPTEAEWERAARGGHEDFDYPWGRELNSFNRQWANTWQGHFPDQNSMDDGYFGTAPVNAFQPNALGLYNMIGNVWEWTSDSWSIRWHAANTEETRRNPKGPNRGHHFKVLKGGSYLCHESYCLRYRNSARSRNSIDSSTGHTGFRYAKNQV